MAAAAILVVGCSKDPEEKLVESFNIDQTSITLADGDEGSTDIVLKSENVTPTVVSNDNWITPTISARVLTLKYAKNDTGAERTGSVTITPGKLDKVTVTVTQPAYEEPVSVKTYKVGDLTEDGKGIVYWVDSSDKSVAKAISIERTTGLSWSAFADEIGANLYLNGSKNAALLLGQTAASEAYPAAYWCSQVGEGWYLPASYELVEVFDIYNGVSHEECVPAQPKDITGAEASARTAFDALLSAHGGEPMNTAADNNNGNSYWTSTEFSPESAWFVRFGKYYLGNDVAKSSTTRYIRCVKVLGDYTYPGEPVVMTATPSSFEVDGTAQAKEVAISVLNGKLSAASVDEESASWCSASVSSEGVVVTVTANESGATRTATVTVTAESTEGVAPGTIDITVNQKPLGKYKIGDLYTENGKVAGVVFWVSDDALSAKVVHINRSASKLAWAVGGCESGADVTETGAKDENDGKANMAKIREFVGDHTADIPAFAYCEELGEGWYWPAASELQDLFAAYNGTTFETATGAQPVNISDAEKTARAAFDKLLTDNGGTALNTAADNNNGDQYIASTETSATTCNSVRFGKPALNADTAKNGTARFIRAVKLVSAQ